MNELIGKTLDQYHLVGKLGEGGMATVFKAYQASLERYVAIKVLPPTLADKDPDFVKRFEREAKSIAQLNHPNVLPIYDFGVAQGYSYIVMRYVKGGQTLRQAIDQHLSQDRAIELICTVADALNYAHKHDIIHRDVKPDNVLLDEGWVLLSDFGLAKITRETATPLTATGIGMGTPAYMSPEQGYGTEIDRRTDIYALGVMLYEMLTGVIPHDADKPFSIMLRRLNELPPSPRTINPTISTSIEQVTLRALATQPQDRYNSAGDFATALRKAAADEASEKSIALTDEGIATVSLPPELLSLPSEKSFPVRRLLIWAIVGSVMAVISMLAWFGFSSISDSSASPVSLKQTGQVVVAATSRPSSTPTLLPTTTPTNTPPPPTDRPSPTPSPTETPLPPTPLVIVVTATATPLPTTLPSAPAATPTPTVTPTFSLPNGALTLLNPAGLDPPSFGPTQFEWEWNGSFPPGYGFEIRVWREGEPPAGAHDAVLDNQQGRIEPSGENRYRLNIDITEAAGVRRRSGEYLWTVALVQISPNYADLGQQAQPIRFRFELAGSDSSGGDSNGSSSSSSSGGIK